MGNGWGITPMRSKPGHAWQGQFFTGLFCKKNLLGCLLKPKQAYNVAMHYLATQFPDHF